MNQTIKGRIEKINNGEVPEGYKKTSFGVFPCDWVVLMLSECLEMTQSGLSRQLEKSDIGVPVIRSNNIMEGRIDFSDLKYWHDIDDQGVNLNNYYLNDGDILLNFINSQAQIGKLAKYKNEINRNAIFTTNLMRLKFNNKLNDNYFIAFSKTIKYNDFIQSITKPAVNQASFTTVDFKRMEILVPLIIKQQENIAGILMKWDEMVEAQEKYIKALELRKKALMQKLLTPKDGWVKSTIGELGQIIGSSVDKKCAENEKKVRLLNYMDVYKRNIIDENFNGYMSVTAKDAQINSFSLKYGDVLFTPSSETSEDIGHSAVFLSNKEVLFSYHLVRLRLNQSIDIKYRAFMFQANYIRKQFTTKAVGPVRFIVSSKQFEDCIIYYPKRDMEQKRIADILSTADEEIELQKQKLEKIKQQRKSLQQLLLTGIVRVNA